MRPHKFHNLPVGTETWHDVLPGDAIISPWMRFYRINDYIDADHHTKIVTVIKKPLLVVGRLEGAYGRADDAPSPKNCSTFIVYSITAGFLIAVIKHA